MKRKFFVFVAAILISHAFITGLNCNVYADTKDEKVVVFVYHHLLEDSEDKSRNNPAAVSVESFEEQMKYLYDNDYTTITLQALNDHLKYGKPLPSKNVLITFDDGYQSNYIYAYPILKKYGFKASIFMITSCISYKTQAFDPERLSFMSKEEIDESKDVFEFACHTHNLHRLQDNGKSTLLNSDKKTIVKDLSKSKRLIHTKFFAYPHGQYNKEIESILKEKGFELAFTVNFGEVDKRSNRFELNRVTIFYTTSIDEFKGILDRYRNDRGHEPVKKSL